MWQRREADVGYPRSARLLSLRLSCVKLVWWCVWEGCMEGWGEGGGSMQRRAAVCKSLWQGGE